MCIFTISGGFNLLIDGSLSPPGLFWIGWGFRSLVCVVKVDDDDEDDDGDNNNNFDRLLLISL